ncbi:hypothetical protein BSKO_10354 [Bryopsis sp. KO-2023]|nr:hypothetical protein BSKO_10354 [Bryopsis sp. KO-2023]
MLVLVGVVVLSLSHVGQAVPGEGLVRVGGLSTMGENGKGFQAYFVDRNCKEFKFSGWNNWEMIEAAAGVASALPDEKQKNVRAGKNLVRFIFDSAEDAHLTVGRFFGHGHNEKKIVLQPELGEYNQKALDAFDWVLAEAGARGLKLIMSFADNWKVGDSRKTYAEKFGGKEPMDFFTDPDIKQMYKDHIDFLVNHENSLNGVKYKDDPTIFAWNLMNEPRCDCDLSQENEFCDKSCASIVQAWIEEISNHLKTVDPNHMAVVGEEGFYSLTPWRTWVNPDAFFSGGAPWAQLAGQDFISNHNLPTIDYLSVHTWPDNWGLPELWFQSVWVREHNNDAWWLQTKPFVVEEFGKIVVEDDDTDRKSIRDPFIRDLYKLFHQLRGGNGAMKGVAFWEFDAATHKKPGVYGIRPTHSTWEDIIVPQSKVVKDEVKREPLRDHCVPGKRRSFDAHFIGEEVYYITSGPHLQARWEGKDIGEPLKGVKSIKECIDACEAEKEDCVQFRYNKNIDDGTCVLKSRGANDYKWSPEGWQTYWRREASTKCKAKGCKLCQKGRNGVCILCEGKAKLYQGRNEIPVCKEK